MDTSIFSLFLFSFFEFSSNLEHELTIKITVDCFIVVTLLAFFIAMYI